MMTHRKQVELEGEVDSRFSEVAGVAENYLSDGAELGISLYVDLNGETLIDAWGGHADRDKTIPWRSDTITNLWSSTKVVTAIAVLAAATQGKLELDTPVSQYWPEFSERGVLVRHVLGHTAGLPAWQAPFSLDQMYDTQYATARLAEQACWWPPGTAGGYHGTTFGMLLGEIIRRTSGATLSEYIDSELAQPLGADFQLGVREGDLDRVAGVLLGYLPESYDSLPEDSLTRRALTAPKLDVDAANTRAWQGTPNGALNGHSNARGVAKIARVVSLGGKIEGREYVSSDILERIFEVQAEGPDLILGVPFTRGIGFALPDKSERPWIPDGRVCFWGGWGGSIVIMDLDRGLTISYQMNKMNPGSVVGSELTERYVSAIYSAL
ncbi:beta-lactamase family protein [Tsukamurella asaccharolytica]|uniref:Beta-lactamase family protein n=1 Tax=Tsukamurella asaccharolytica TaxID=2592067 RepID=A0A5C5R6V4_9ACTN|nr:serine hydrolase domain-containing protein [Tsukamurella asaccharolytica]TWS18436.1 beta-lactamase family protein [Tsukamurella asaccharolytica]